jgi:outer membrane protein
MGRPLRFLIPLALAALAAPAAAQDEEKEAKPPKRTRIGLGVQAVPSYPGSDGHSFRPLLDFSRARGEEVFEFEAPDESFGFAVLKGGGFEFGPAFSLQGSRKPSEVGAPVEKVDFTIEAGAFVQAWLGDSFRIRAEGRRGLGGHDGWVGTIGADYVARDKDRYVFSIGPRLGLADGAYQRAYYGVSPTDSAATGLPVYRPGGGIQSIGITSSLHVALSPRWGIYGFAQAERLVSDAGDSPLVRAFGSRTQLSGGVALTYTFGRGVKSRGD